jgi:opacity protein-like surface antigen
MKLSRLLVSLGILASGSVFAGITHDKIVVPEPVCGPWYVSVYGGGSFFDDEVDFTEVDPDDSVPERARINFDNGWILGGAVGRRLRNNWRVELDLNHHQAPSESYAYSDDGDPFETGLTIQGDVETTSLLVNVVKEFGENRWRPYLGAGFGLSSVNLRLSDSIADDEIQDSFADEVVFGYQFMTGVVFDLTDCLQAYLEYRVMGHGDVEDVVSDDTSEFENLAPMDLGWSQHLILGSRIFF